MVKQNTVNFDPGAYAITIQRQAVDGEDLYVGKVREFPDVKVYEKTFDAAHSAVLDVLRTLFLVYQEEGSKFPGPEKELEYSGRITLRIPKFLHRELSLASEREGVSINQYVVSILSRSSFPLVSSYGFGEVYSVTAYPVATSIVFAASLLSPKPDIIQPNVTTPRTPVIKLRA